MSRTIGPSGQEIVNVKHRTTPYMVSLTGTGKSIELSADDGQSWEPAAMDMDTGETVSVTIFGVVTTIRLTAAPGSQWRIM